ncbi:MAG: hypothetical protein LBP33_06470, partial [Candidatus Adiutrix sp.]|nr:hypothetical protein [Candidatus Adiutrix sp.]
MAKQRDKRGRFSKGASGNPGGRKPLTPEAKALFESNVDRAAYALIALLDNSDGNLRLKAANSILDRVY